MPQEIERKFLVSDASYRQLAYAARRMVQGYICSRQGRTVRVRIVGEATATKGNATVAEGDTTATKGDATVAQGGATTVEKAGARRFLTTAPARAFLTIKGPSDDGGLSRYEWEQELSLDDARELLRLCEPGAIDKTRYLVRVGRHTFEVDEFHGANRGLVVAEVELQAADEPFDRPAFLGAEVTGDRRYYNSQLTLHPYSTWADDAASAWCR